MLDAAVIVYSSRPAYESAPTLAYLRNRTTLPVLFVGTADLRHTALTKGWLDDLRRRASGPGKVYVQKALFAWTLAHVARRLIVLDSDLVVVRSLDPLATFRVEGGLALAREQASWYAHALNGTAFNGGVQLHDVEKIAADSCYRAALLDGSRIGWHGDQTLYARIHRRCPGSISVLPCEWNRQVGSRDMDGRAGVETREEDVACVGCSVLHLNVARKKQGLASLRAFSSCSEWATRVTMLREPHWATLRQCCHRD